jgi:arsenite methyltransferase
MTMTELRVFDPALCCSTGVCGPEVDPALVRFAADLEWLRSRGVEVRRSNLSREPSAFAEHRQVHEALQRDGTECLPLLLLNGQVAARGRYPSRGEMAGWTGIEASIAAPSGMVTLGALPGSCDPSSGCC